MESPFEHLKSVTDIVADTGDIASIKKLLPKDATTNPTLILKAAEANDDLSKELIEEAIQSGIKKFDSKDPNNQKLVSFIADKVAVNFGKEILKFVQGYVSTEVDARISFDKEAMIEKARSLIKLYEETGISKDRILIKIAATWEGIKAAEELEKEGIKCNLTLVMTFAQAVACAESNIFLISPFVGRINDGWANKLKTTFTPENEPGIILVKKIYNYFKKYDYKTVIMAASLRTPESTLEITGCDKITMPPGVIEGIKKLSIEGKIKLSVEEAKKLEIEKINLDEKSFRWLVNEDEIGNEKLCDGIRLFSKDIIKLEKIIKDKLAQK